MVEMGNHKSMFHPSTKSFRFSVLLFTSLLTFGTYFAYDIIGAIAPSLVERLTKYEVTNATLDSLMVLDFPYQVIDDLGRIKNQQIEGKGTRRSRRRRQKTPQGTRRRHRRRQGFHLLPTFFSQAKAGEQARRRRAQ